jgi:ribulose-5-phosphate 4-epimerase/fuculose-1-phosphate aldolase
MILRNHGLLVAGATAAWAFHEIWFLERACQIQVRALAGGQALSIPSPLVQEHTALQFASPESAEIVDLAWHATLELIAGQQADIQRWD